MFAQDTCMFAQDIDSLINIKGYYVTVFSKQEIVFSYEQKIKKEKGEFYSTPIDYETRRFFIPVQVGNKIVCEKDMLIEKFLNPLPSDSTYVIPNGEYDFLKRINIIKEDVFKETCIRNTGMGFSPYYEVSVNNNSLFKIVYIEGYARHKRIYEIEEKWQNYLWNIFCYDKKTENIEFFFIVKINDYTPYIEISDLKKWLPYLE
jgi:hypothetical protein